jgi:hypothetical protein
MGVYCECAAGQFTGTVPWSDFSDKIKTFRNIARHHCLPLLAETVEWVVKMNPHLETK